MYSFHFQQRIDVPDLVISTDIKGHTLHGITRAAVLALCEREGLRVEERPFTVDEVYTAREAFSTSASSFVMPVVQVDERVIANGKPGSVATQLRSLYIEMALAQTSA